MKYDYILKAVRKLKKKYQTNDLYKICEKMGILINLRPMGSSPKSAKGFFACNSRIPVITINSDLPGIVRRFILAHELGHAVLHAGAGIRLFHDMVLFDEKEATEKEANLFAAEILLEDQEVISYLQGGMSFFETAAVLNVPAELLDFKLRMMRMKGCAPAEVPAAAPVSSKSTFLKNMAVPANCDFDPA